MYSSWPYANAAAACGSVAETDGGVASVLGSDAKAADVLGPVCKAAAKKLVLFLVLLIKLLQWLLVLANAETATLPCAVAKAAAVADSDPGFVN
jgi:hypothetical protein